jgi:uncharacterized small protein (DUF1192 family)
MGLFGFFGSTKTKADIDREIASLQGDVERLKASYAVAKERQKWKNGVNYNPQQYPPMIAEKKAKIASLKAQRKNAPN